MTVLIEQVVIWTWKQWHIRERPMEHFPCNINSLKHMILHADGWSMGYLEGFLLNKKVRDMNWYNFFMFFAL